MAEQIAAIKQIAIGENKHDIDAKYWGGMESSIVNDLASKDYVNEKIFVGTMTEYETAYANNKIAVGALVVILDKEQGGNPGGDTGGDNAGSSTTAKLGVAVLGQMKLGQE